jgi:hypothetical protein
VGDKERAGGGERKRYRENKREQERARESKREQERARESKRNRKDVDIRNYNDMNIKKSVRDGGR